MVAMRRPLFISGAGAVTPVGLTAPQTCAAIRAGISAYEEIFRAEPIGASQIVTRIPTHWSLRSTEGEWLVNMAARAIAEAMRSGEVASENTVLLIAPPESGRAHPCYEDVKPADFVSAVSDASKYQFHGSSRAIDGGAAAMVAVLQDVEDLLSSSSVSQVILGGVDSLISELELTRYDTASRLKGDDNSQGLVPGEGAVFLRITANPDSNEATQVRIDGIGVATEKDTALSENYSQGRAMERALNGAISQGTSESEISYVVSNSNGERYSGWEQLIARPRFYRTRREYMATAYPAMSAGEIGCASGALSLLIAADSHWENYAPGEVAMVEVASDFGLRAAAVVRGVV